MRQNVLTWIAAGVIGLGAMTVGSPGAQAQMGGGEGGLAGAQRIVRATATVQALDADKRTVELTDADGDVIKIKVPESIKAFDNLRKGDRIDVSYKQALAIRLQPSGGSPGIEERNIEERSGSKLTVGHQVMASAEIVGVDALNGKLRIKGPDGKVHKVNVEEPDLRQKLSTLKTGQHLKVTYTEAIASSLVPAQKNP